MEELYGQKEYPVLGNVHLGVTAENQATWEQRRNAFLATPASARYISYEPALGPLLLSPDELRQIDLVICGGETGPGARPMHPGWARSVRDQCAEAGAMFHFKSWGEWLPNAHGDKSIPPGIDFEQKHFLFDDGIAVCRVGKKHAGHLLDGVVHRALL